MKIGREINLNMSSIRIVSCPYRIVSYRIVLYYTTIIIVVSMMDFVPLPAQPQPQPLLAYSQSDYPQSTSA